MAFRFFVNPTDIKWNEKRAVISDPGDTYKISKVLRLRANDPIVLLDGNGIFYNAQINQFISKKVQCRLLSRQAVNSEPGLKITIAQSLLKGPKLDYALQKSTEVGAFDFIPLTSERTVVRFDVDEDKYLDRKIGRYQKIVQNAAEQSERGKVPIVHNIMKVGELCRSNLSEYDLKLICKERTSTNGIKEVLNGVVDKVSKVLVLIGPEGGFTDEETKEALANDFVSVSLGKRIYRSETVGALISSILFYHFNELN